MSLLRLSRAWPLLAVTVLLAACSQSPFGSTASATNPARLPGPASPANNGATKHVEIVDPVLRMTAYSMNIPAKWAFEGAVMAGTACAAFPFPVLRMMSPDGISEYKMMPRFDWSWSSLPKAPNAPANSCLPFTKEISAPDFLQHMASILGVTVVRDAPFPAELAAKFQANLNQSNQRAAANALPGAPAFHTTGSQARILVRYNINSIPVDEYLGTTVSCTDNPQPLIHGYAHFYSCSAYLSRTRAPQGQLDAMQSTMDSVALKSFTINQEWNRKVVMIGMRKLDDAVRQGGAAVLKMGQDMERARQAQQASWQLAQDMRKREHDDFMASLQQNAERFQNTQKASSDAKAQAASDWADYALDVQKRYNPVTGQISRDSNLYTYSWVNEEGKHFLTNYVNDNPNGRNTGNWTLQENVK